MSKWSFVASYTSGFLHQSTCIVEDIDNPEYASASSFMASHDSKLLFPLQFTHSKFDSNASRGHVSFTHRASGRLCNNREVLALVRESRANGVERDSPVPEVEY